MRLRISKIRIVFLFLASSSQLFSQGMRMSDQLYPKLKNHLQALSQDDNGEKENPYPEQSQKISEVMKELLKSGGDVSVLVVCTGNSRRSMMAAALGNSAAAYYDLDKVHFFSGGTTPSAFNPRAINSLKEIGFEIEPTGEKATTGPKGELNPIYQVKWGKGEGLQKTEYSKLYSDVGNPKKRFIAMMVCDEASKNCPVVPGAVQRFAVPFQDPKKFDGTPEEAQQYAKRRDDLGRFLIRILGRVKPHQ